MTFRPVTEETSVTHFARKSCLGDELWQNCLKSWEETQKSHNNKLHWNSGEQTFVIFILTFTPNGNQTLNYPHCWPSHHQHRWPDKVPFSVFFLLNSAVSIFVSHQIVFNLSFLKIRTMVGSRLKCSGAVVFGILFPFLVEKRCWQVTDAGLRYPHLT